LLLIRVNWKVFRFERFVVSHGASLVCQDKSQFWIPFKVILNLM
jgi:hypothetical protein